MNNTVWFTFEEQRRNWELAKAIGCEYREYSFSRKTLFSKIKGLVSGIFNVNRYLMQNRPTVVFCQNPSIVLTLFCSLVKPLYGYRLFVDNHNYGLERTTPKWLRRACRWAYKNTDGVIVSNEFLFPIVEAMGGKPIALPDKIPNIICVEPKKEKDSNIHDVLFVCSYAKDEPYEEVFAAAAEFMNRPDTYKQLRLYVTGNYHKVGIDPAQYSKNIHFLGRVPWNEYERLLRDCDIVLDLTTRDHCLVCGAYEAVAMKKPMILSDTKAIRDYFSHGALYTKPDKDSIFSAMLISMYYQNILAEDVKTAKQLIGDKWNKYFSELLNKIKP